MGWMLLLGGVGSDFFFFFYKYSKYGTLKSTSSEQSNMYKSTLLSITLPSIHRPRIGRVGSMRGGGVRPPLFWEKVIIFLSKMIEIG